MLGAQTSAFAADYTGEVTSNTVAPGGTITYSADDTDEDPFTTGTASLTGELALEEAVITPASTLVTSVTTDAAGDLDFSIKLPTSAPVGSVYTLEVIVGEFYDVQTFVLAGVPVDTAANASGALPSTGVDATPYVWFGGGLLILGAGLVSVLAFVRRSSKTA
ncbi:LPXTG-motif cell wall-anchored protein [Glaciihabitans tibetensis]|uniref:LPXTG-motif cell wall-anchored protein n=1 Tax=Glaciihabitans tibetensis TaxID=1266600 RepID=A0A2T0V3L1_9MICO|nr:LPXTG-motif cell wall-anchored protein [Glaciihabitans tibetensis]